jgi:2-polyprenyl-6-methoxyphenol hydroxylase-like FAD-dependent oxidoreductase
MSDDVGYDVLIIGARVAGAATAMLLARAGVRVLVVDQSRAGSDTFSTHALMRGGVIQLSRWGLLDELRRAGTPPVRRTVVRYGSTEEIVEVAPIPHCDALYAPRRTVLDPLLVDAARRAGATVRFGVRVTGLLRNGSGRVVGAVARDGDGRSLHLLARLTIGADGRRSLVARQVRARIYASGRHASALIGGYVDGIEVDGYQWLYAPGASAGIIPTNGGQASVWVGLPSHAFRDLDCGLPHAFWEALQHTSPEHAALVARGSLTGPLRGFPGSPGFLREPWGPGWALVGDAAHFKDPLSAHGMTDALRDAELLADAIIAVRDGSRRERDAMVGFRDLRDELSRQTHALTDRVASYDWDLTELRELLVALSRSMRPEVSHLLERATRSSAAHPFPKPV